MIHMCITLCVSVSYVDIFGQAEEYVDVWELEHCGNLAEGKVGRSTVCVCVDHLYRCKTSLRFLSSFVIVHDFTFMQGW